MKIPFFPQCFILVEYNIIINNFEQMFKYESYMIEKVASSRWSFRQELHVTRQLRDVVHQEDALHFISVFEHSFYSNI